MADLTSKRLEAIAGGDAMTSKERESLIAMARRGHAESERDFRRGVRQGISIARRFARIIERGGHGRPPRIEWCDANAEAKRIGVDNVDVDGAALVLGRVVIGWLEETGGAADLVQRIVAALASELRARGVTPHG